MRVQDTIKTQVKETIKRDLRAENLQLLDAI